MPGRKKSYNTPCKEDPTGLDCMVYTRVSSEERLNREFTSLDNQLAKCLDYIKLRSEDNWVFQREYRDAGFTGGNLDRPALQDLIKDIVAEKVDVVLVHKLDRLTRRLLHFHPGTHFEPPSSEWQLPGHTRHGNFMLSQASPELVQALPIQAGGSIAQSETWRESSEAGGQAHVTGPKCAYILKGCRLPGWLATFT